MPIILQQYAVLYYMEKKPTTYECLNFSNSIKKY